MELIIECYSSKSKILTCKWACSLVFENWIPSNALKLTLGVYVLAIHASAKQWTWRAMAIAMIPLDFSLWWDIGGTLVFGK